MAVSDVLLVDLIWASCAWKRTLTHLSHYRIPLTSFLAFWDYYAKYYVSTLLLRCVIFFTGIL